MITYGREGMEDLMSPWFALIYDNFLKKWWNDEKTLEAVLEGKINDWNVIHRL